MTSGESWFSSLIWRNREREGTCGRAYTIRSRFYLDVEPDIGLATGTRRVDRSTSTAARTMAESKSYFADADDSNYDKLEQQFEEVRKTLVLGMTALGCYLCQ